MDELEHGMRVRVKGTLFYNGRVGTLGPTSGDPEDPWDFHVELDAAEVPEGHPVSGEAQTIAVFYTQVEPLAE